MVMTNEIYTIDTIKSLIIPLLTKEGISKAVLFGSYAKNEATSNSDIDILVDSQGTLIGLDFIGLLEDLREVLGKDVDLFDVTHIEVGSKVDNEISSTGVVIYEK